MRNSKKTLLIVGGGFAGMTIITQTYKQFNIILLDQKSYFEFVPSVFNAFIHPESIFDLTLQFKQSKFGVLFIQGKLTHIEDNIAYYEGGQIEFDYCAITIGSNYTNPIKSTIPKLSDRFIELKKAQLKIIESQTILIIGGGTVGIELACEIKASYKQKTVALITKGKILSTMPKSASEYAKKRMLNLGIEIQENYIGPSLDSNFDLVFNCKGNNYESVRLNNNFEMFDPKKQLLVDDYLKIRTNQNIYCAGDICISSQNETKTAFAAEMQGEIIAYNLKHPNKQIKSYWIPNTYIISLGGWKAVFVFETFTFGGFIPYLMKLFIEVVVVNDFRGIIGFNTIHQIMNYIVYVMLYIYMIMQLLFAIAPLGSKIKQDQRVELKRIQQEIEEFKKQ
ncbi:unnamed protein product [Paramecium primaurelia]|uniref:FAD/NAD(P)-binding domain-containing protein n=2 Tax=Paramecium primaurelia TaxID=5886 RepID=A0A8S1JQA4_PARPR|nr:unnamed protein product [Paramecium primaurelia]